MRWVDHPGLLYAPLVGSGLKSGWFAGLRHIENVSTATVTDGKEMVTVRDLDSAPRRFVKLMIATDGDGDGLPDSWELELFGDLNQAGGDDFDLDGLCNLFEWEEGGGREAADYYNGATPTLTVAGGSGQQGPPESLLPLPLSVLVRNASGVPLENAPVTFAVTQGFGEADSIGEVRTNSLGIASTGFWTAPMDDTSTVVASATVVTTGTVVNVSFTETTIAAPAPPEGVDWETASESTVSVGWTDASDTETSFTIEQTTDNGATWQPVATVGANVSQVTVSTPAVGSFAFRAQANNATGSSKKVLSNAYGASDEDDDGLDNQEEQDEETDKNNPDSDGDLKKDGEDASPLDPEITHPRVPRPSYAVIDLTQAGLSSGDTLGWINDHGQILGAGPLNDNFVWEAGVRTAIPLSGFCKMNNLGEVVGYDPNYPYPEPGRAAKWSAATGIVPLPIYNPPLEANETIDPESWANGLNDTGQIVGGGESSIYEAPLHMYYNPIPARISYACGMTWDQSTVSAVGPVIFDAQTGPGGAGERQNSGGSTWALAPWAINNSGTVVGYTTDKSFPPLDRAFVSTGGTPALLPNVEPDVSAWDINDGASLPGGQTAILGGQGDQMSGIENSTIWIETASGWKGKYLGRYSPATQSNELQRAFWTQLNDRLEITGRFYGSDYKTTGQLWQNGKVRNLNPALLKQGWLLTEATHINNNGAIIGRAKKVSGVGAGKVEKPVLVVDVKIVPDDGMVGVVGDMIPSNKGDTGEKHFVSPKKTTEIPDDYVNLKVTGVTPAMFQSLLQWEPVTGGEAIQGDPLKYRVKRDLARKVEVKVTVKGSGDIAAKMNVWIVWCDPMPRIGTGEDVSSPSWLAYEVPNTPADCWRFVFAIKPAEIITNNAERPDLEGGPNHWTPGYTKSWPSIRFRMPTRHL